MAKGDLASPSPLVLPSSGLHNNCIHPPAVLISAMPFTNRHAEASIRGTCSSDGRSPQARCGLIVPYRASCFSARLHLHFLSCGAPCRGEEVRVGMRSFRLKRANLRLIIFSFGELLYIYQHRILVAANFHSPPPSGQLIHYTDDTTLRKPLGFRPQQRLERIAWHSLRFHLLRARGSISLV